MAGSRRPVVLVRGGLRSEDERQPGGFGSGAAPFRDVVLGLDSAAPNDTVIGKAGSHLVETSRDASPVVAGCPRRRTPIDAAIGPVTHAVLHHATAPVAVVPHA
ncbi:universal stress protein [Streptomyces sp. NEAU-174]|uniref:universal stress protein n=1 Tax=Streptomyces sp. NEAU-174 TaxID=3458254 RepID=UPI00404504B5